jgi:hypothetical protein
MQISIKQIRQLVCEQLTQREYLYRAKEEFEV